MLLEDYTKILDTTLVYNHSVYLINSFNKWNKSHGLPENRFTIHPELVKQVSLNLFVDFKRIKDFHKIKEVNCKKFAAYQAAWIVRLRPIQISGFVSKKKMYLLVLANELFALHTVLARMYDISTEEFLGVDQLNKWTTFLEKMVYHFHHRIINPQALELTFEAMGLIPPYPDK